MGLVLFDLIIHEGLPFLYDQIKQNPQNQVHCWNRKGKKKVRLQLQSAYATRRCTPFVNSRLH